MSREYLTSLWIHGGAWLEGSKDEYAPLGYLAEGYAVASINYRLSQHAIFPVQIEDCKAAVRWLRANAQKYNLDPQRFAAWGASAGGHGGFTDAHVPEVTKKFLEKYL